MKISGHNVAGRVAFLVGLVLASFGAAASAQTPAKSLKDQITGHWQLVSVSINGNAPYGASPEGSMFIDAAGNYSVIVVTGGKARSLAYFGTYTLDDANDLMTMHVDASNQADDAGRDVKRLISLSGDEMIVATQTPSGAAGSIKLTWKRSN